MKYENYVEDKKKKIIYFDDKDLLICWHIYKAFEIVKTPTCFDPST